MKHLLFSLAAISLFAVSPAYAGSTHSTAAHKSGAEQVVKDFFSAFGKGDVEGVIAAFHEKAEITAVRKGERTGTQVYGSYVGKDGAREFISNLGKNFDTKAFNVNHVIGSGNLVFADGNFTHIIRSSGKPFSSDWALMCIIKDGKIAEYHFYEDSAALEHAQ